MTVKVGDHVHSTIASHTTCLAAVAGQGPRIPPLLIRISSSKLITYLGQRGEGTLAVFLFWVPMPESRNKLGVAIGHY